MLIQYNNIVIAKCVCYGYENVVCRITVPASSLKTSSKLEV